MDNQGRISLEELRGKGIEDLITIIKRGEHERIKLRNTLRRVNLERAIMVKKVRFIIAEYNRQEILGV